MSNLRQRQPERHSNASPAAPPKKDRRGVREEEDQGLSTLDIIRVIAALVIASCGLSYYITNSESLIWGYQPWFTRWPVVKSYLV